MGHRISRVVTRTGDDGTTGLADGSRRAKHDLRIAAIGDVDELNCALGVLLTQPMDHALRVPLAELQHRLFDLGGALAMPDHGAFDPRDVAWLEAVIQDWNARLPPLKEFVLPGGNVAGAQAHAARALARRVERSLWALDAVEPLDAALLAFANRLSDLLFIAARRLVREQGGHETSWRRPQG